ncbi:50S ribosomal protein L32 [symbiont of Argiope bruennichi]|uniref:50S ribosomal protein L32 n=1 Tax=symbiont of Argiope bruennichi TaxID=2810479 RepID=UPI003DA3F02A
MAVPFRRTSKTRKRLRRSHLALKKQTFVVCSNCGAMHLPHKVCKSCGFYNGKKLI